MPSLPTPDELMTLSHRYGTILPAYIEKDFYESRHEIAEGLRHLAENPSAITPELVSVYNTYRFMMPSHPACFDSTQLSNDVSSPRETQTCV